MINKKFNVAVLMVCLAFPGYSYGMVRALAGVGAVSGSGLAISGGIGIFMEKVRYTELSVLKIQLQRWKNHATLGEILKKDPERGVALEKLIQWHQDYFQKHGLPPLSKVELHQLTPAQFVQRFLEHPTCKNLESNHLKIFFKQLGKVGSGGLLALGSFVAFIKFQ